jgi:hypothetical protein
VPRRRGLLGTSPKKFQKILHLSDAQPLPRDVCCDCYLRSPANDSYITGYTGSGQLTGYKLVKKTAWCASNRGSVAVHATRTASNCQPVLPPALSLCEARAASRTVRCISAQREGVGAACVLSEIAQLYTASPHLVVEHAGSWSPTGLQGWLCPSSIQYLGYRFPGTHLYRKVGE